MSGKEFLGKVAVLLFSFLYKYCYITGLFTLRVLEDAGRLFSRRIFRAERAVSDGARRLARGVKRGVAARRLRLRAAAMLARRIPASVRAAAREGLGRNPRGCKRLLLRALRDTAALAAPAVRTAVNLALPIAAALLLWQTVQQMGRLQYALRVSYGSPSEGFADFGYITDESVYDRAISEVLQKMQGVNAQPVNFSARFELTPVAPDAMMLDPYTLSNRIIAASGADFREAYGLYVDGRLINAVTDKQPLLDLLCVMLDAHKSGDPTETVSFVKNIAVREGLYPVERVVNLSGINASINRDVRGEFVYKAEQGDSASVISQKFDIPQSQIVANNPWILTSLLIGDEVLIERAQPFLSVKSERIEVYKEEMAYPTENIEDDALLKGQKEKIRDGREGVQQIRAAVTYVNDMETDRQILERTTLKEPVSEQYRVGTKLFSLSGGAGKVSSNFIWPVPGMKYISNYFNGNSYSRYAHGALDMAANYGTPIYASAPGTVTYSAYTPYGYGRHIIINHGGGVQTLYAHNSQNVVKIGEYVEQGQIIGYVGSTGNSTGNHCHFEIRINGTKKNPTAYLP